VAAAVASVAVVVFHIHMKQPSLVNKAYDGGGNSSESPVASGELSSLRR